MRLLKNPLVLSLALSHFIVDVLNGQTGIGEIDLFNKDAVITTGDVSLGKHQIKAGLNQLTVELLGANPAASPGKMFGLDHLKLVPVK